MTAAICGSRCPVHEHVCQRSPMHQAGICRDRKQKGAESCTWGPERNRVLLKHGERLDILRAAVARQGGEWTPGRVKRLFAQHNLTHVYRVNIRRLLERLLAEGVLECHETPGRRYYTRSDGPRYDVLG